MGWIFKQKEENKIHNLDKMWSRDVIVTVWIWSIIFHIKIIGSLSP